MSWYLSVVNYLVDKGKAKHVAHQVLMKFICQHKSIIGSAKWQILSRDRLQSSMEAGLLWLRKGNGKCLKRSEKAEVIVLSEIAQQRKNWTNSYGQQNGQMYHQAVYGPWRILWQQKKNQSATPKLVSTNINRLSHKKKICQRFWCFLLLWHQTVQRTPTHWNGIPW